MSGAFAASVIAAEPAKIHTQATETTVKTKKHQVKKHAANKNHGKKHHAKKEAVKKEETTTTTDAVE